MKKIYIICSVEDTSEEYRVKLKTYSKSLEDKGYKVYLPHRDIGQLIAGIDICTQNTFAIGLVDEVHILYDNTFFGSPFDLNVAFTLNKSIKAIVDLSGFNNKKFSTVVINWDPANCPSINTIKNYKD